LQHTVIARAGMDAGRAPPSNPARCSSPLVFTAATAPRNAIDCACAAATAFPASRCCGAGRADECLRGDVCGTATTLLAPPGDQNPAACARVSVRWSILFQRAVPHRSAQMADDGRVAVGPLTHGARCRSLRCPTANAVAILRRCRCDRCARQRRLARLHTIPGRQKTRAGARASSRRRARTHHRPSLASCHSAVWTATDSSAPRCHALPSDTKGRAERLTLLAAARWSLTYLTPHALHSVRAPSGPRLHCGVALVPHALQVRVLAGPGPSSSSSSSSWSIPAPLARRGTSSDVHRPAAPSFPESSCAVPCQGGWRLDLREDDVAKVILSRAATPIAQKPVHMRPPHAQWPQRAPSGALRNQVGSEI